MIPIAFIINPVNTTAKSSRWFLLNRLWHRHVRGFAGLLTGMAICCVFFPIFQKRSLEEPVPYRHQQVNQLLLEKLQVRFKHYGPTGSGGTYSISWKIENSSPVATSCIDWVCATPF